MRKSLRTLFVASALMAGIAVAPALYAHESQGSQDSAMGPGMMGQGGMMDGGNMMGQMSTMMESCNKMMQEMMGGHGADHPNDQWRNNKPAQPEN